jgi:hypothetical protein
MSDILFIQHKTNMMYPEIIPMSLPAIINRVHKRFPVRGAFLGGISEKDIRCAKILILSIHWYVSMKGAIQVVFGRNKLTRKLVSSRAACQQVCFPPFFFVIPKSTILSGVMETFPCCRLRKDFCKAKTLRKYPMSPVAITFQRIL